MPYPGAMHVADPPHRTPGRSAGALWAAVLALLFATQAIFAPPARSAASGDVQLLRAVSAAPLAVQARDVATILHVASRAGLPHHGVRSGDAPPLPSALAAGPAPSIRAARPAFPHHATAALRGHPGERYRARAPPSRG